MFHGFRKWSPVIWRSFSRLVFSQRVLLALIEHGLSREKAYDIVQQNSMKSWEEGSDFPSLLREDLRLLDIIPAHELEHLFDYSYYTRYVDEVFERFEWS